MKHEKYKRKEKLTPGELKKRREERPEKVARRQWQQWEKELEDKLFMERFQRMVERHQQPTNDLSKYAGTYGGYRPNDKPTILQHIRRFFLGW